MSHHLGSLCWNELVTGNVKAAKEFYSKAFGWQFIDHDMGDMNYTVVRLNEKEIGGMWQIPKGKEHEIKPHWMVYILVEEIEAGILKATKAGATLVKPATRAGDFGIFAIIADPTGAHVALWEPLGTK